MAIKILVWGSIIFLLGGIALVTYLTCFNGNNGVNYAEQFEKSRLRYITKADKGYAYTIKQLDSLTAADNYKFTKANAVDHPFSEL